MLALSIFLVSFINIGLQNNISLYLTTAKNYTLADTANIITVMFVVSIFGKVILGYIYDKFGITFGALYGLIFLVISIALFLNASPEVVIFGIMFAVLFALVHSMTTVAPPFVTASIVGVKHYATIFGIMNLFYGIGLVTGPQLVAKLSESFGSYTTVWMMLGGLGFVFAASTILAVKKGSGYNQLADA
jgi:MFS family permease